jgi:hypothetical protein
MTRRRLLLLAATFACVTGIGTEDALAGSFSVSACGAAPGFANNSWLPFNTDSVNLQTPNSCGAPDVVGQSASTSGLAASGVLGLSTAATAGGTAGWRFTAPAGDTIGAITADRDLFLVVAPGWVADIVDASGAPLPDEVCSYDPAQIGCEIDGDATHTGLDTSSLAIQIVCNPTPFDITRCSGGSSINSVRAELNSANVTVTDNQPPTLTGTAGSLFATSGYQHGTVTGTISGSDNSGVAGVTVYLDGYRVTEGAFDCNYTLPEPCPASATSSTLSLDTTHLTDGPHQIQASITDAAGNETRGPVQQLLVANHPPAAPVGLAVTGAPDGWINHPAMLTWTNPAQGEGLPIAGVDWVTCPGVEASIPASGCGTVHSQTTPATSLSEDTSAETAFAGHLPGNYTVFVWLVDAAGDLNPANAGHASFGFDNTSPGPPLALTTTVNSRDHSFVLRAKPPAHVAPITSLNWIACKTGGKCTAVRNVAGQAFGFDPATNPTFKAAPNGRYVIRVWLEDAAGNTSQASAASTTVTYPGGSHAASTERRSPLLRVTSVTIKGRDMRVKGTATRALEGHVHVTEHCLVGQVDRLVRRTATVVAGHFSTELVQPPGAHAERVTVTFAGDKRLRAETVTRQLARS